MAIVVDGEVEEETNKEENKKREGGRRWSGGTGEGTGGRSREKNQTGIETLRSLRVCS